MSDYWSEEGSVREYDGDAGDTGITVNGSFLAVEPGSSFSAAVVDAARDASFGKFTVYLNGEKIETDQAPSNFEAGMKADIRPYDQAG